MASEQPVPITPGVGVNVDAVAVGGNVRQVMVIGDPNTTANIAPVDPTLGLSVNVTNSPSITGTITANQGGAWSVSSVQSGIWSVAQSGLPWQVRDTSNPQVQISGGTLTGISNTVTVAGTVTSTPSGTQNVNVTSSVPNLTLTSLPTVTVNQGTNPWVVSSGTAPVIAATSNGLTVNGTVTVNQGVASAPTVSNAWPVNVVSSTPHLTLTSLPNVTVTGSGTVGSPAAGVITIQGSTQMAPLSVVNQSSSIGVGYQVVVTAGTKVGLTTTVPTLAKRVFISATPSNYDVVVVGNTSVVAAQPLRMGIPLSGGQLIDFNIDDLSKVFLDSTVSGSTVTYMFTS